MFQVTPLTALKFAELAARAGLPKGVVNILPGSGEINNVSPFGYIKLLYKNIIRSSLHITKYFPLSLAGALVGQRLSDHPDVRKLGFTGSTEIGKHIMKR